MPAAADASPKPNMGAWALAYARRGFHVFPVHAPLFDHPKDYRCSCEEYRHSKRCQDKHPWLYLAPDQHCQHPGKHPRGVEHGKDAATTDETQIRTWWGKYPDANIGCVPGRNGYAVLDADLYKEHFGGADLLTRAEEETPTVLTGGGGNHLWYRKHAGAVYSNAPGDLPAGMDVRADNGYVILPPSLHPSGRRYQWEDGYGPHELEPQLLPARIHDVLLAATAAAAQTSARFTTAPRWDGLPTTPAPDLAQWSLSTKVRGEIGSPAERGKRSETDMHVVQALVYAGAGDDDILAVFEHHPIGQAGKFAEAGRRYLERTIGAARAYAQEHPKPAAVEETLAAARTWLHRIDLAEHVPIEKQCAAGYRTRERDLAVADAILEVFAGYNSLEGPLGLRQLRRMTNLGGLATVGRALACLTPWFIRPAGETDADGAGAGEAAHRYELACSSICCVDGTPTTVEPLLGGVPSTQHIYGEYRAHDAFNATTTPITPQMIAERAESGEPYSTRYTLTAVYRRRLQAALPGAGRAALAVVAALVNAGGELRLGDLVGLGGRSKFTISRTVGRLLELDLVAVDAGAVQLRTDWQAWLQQITELMPTAGNGKRRIVRDAITTIQSCDAFEAEHRQESRQLPAWVHKRREQARQMLQRLAPGYRPSGVGRVDKQELFTTGRLVWAQMLELGEVKRDEMIRLLSVAGFSAEDITAGERYGKGAFNHTPEYAAYMAAAAA